MANDSKKNPLRLLEDSDREREAKLQCELPSDWIKDMVVDECIAEYRRLLIEATPILKFIHEAEVTIVQAAELIKNIREQNTELLKVLSSVDKRNLDEIKEFNNASTALLQNINLIFRQIASVKDISVDLKNMSKQWHEEDLS